MANVKAITKTRGITEFRGLMRRPDLEYRQLGMDSAVYDPATGIVHMLNATATAVWNHITEDRTAKNVSDVLALSFNMIKEHELRAIEGDLQWILAQFMRQNLLVSKSFRIPKPLAIKGDANRYLPDHEISTMSKGYIKPSMKSYSIQDLKGLFDLGISHPAPFADTWVPDRPSIK